MKHSWLFYFGFWGALFFSHSSWAEFYFCEATCINGFFPNPNHGGSRNLRTYFVNDPSSDIFTIRNEQALEDPNEAWQELRDKCGGKLVLRGEVSTSPIEYLYSRQWGFFYAYPIIWFTNANMSTSCKVIGS